MDSDHPVSAFTESFLGLGPGTNNITSLCLNLLICNLKILATPTSWGSWREKHIAWHTGSLEKRVNHDWMSPGGNSSLFSGQPTALGES